MSLEHSPARAGDVRSGSPQGTLSDWTTIEGFVRDHPDKFTESQIRWALRFREENGLAEHVTRMGRRIYIHVPGFTEWFQRRGQED